MPKLEEGNIWACATMPNMIPHSYAPQRVNQMRRVFTWHPQVTAAVSQLGRPEDGTDPTSYGN